MAAHRLPHPALHTVSNHCLTQGARNSEPEAGWHGVTNSGQAESDKIAAGHADTALIDLAELRRPDNPIFLG